MLKKKKNDCSDHTLLHIAFILASRYTYTITVTYAITRYTYTMSLLLAWYTLLAHPITAKAFGVK